MPFPARHFPLNCFQDDIAKRAFLLARVSAQLVMQLLRYVFDLNIRHVRRLACRGHAGNAGEIPTMLASTWRLRTSHCCVRTAKFNGKGATPGVLAPLACRIHFISDRLFSRCCTARWQRKMIRRSSGCSPTSARRRSPRPFQ